MYPRSPAGSARAPGSSVRGRSGRAPREHSNPSGHGTAARGPGRVRAAMRGPGSPTRRRARVPLPRGHTSATAQAAGTSTPEGWPCPRWLACRPCSGKRRVWPLVCVRPRVSGAGRSCSRPRWGRRRSADSQLFVPQSLATLRTATHPFLWHPDSWKRERPPDIPYAPRREAG